MKRIPDAFIRARLVALYLLSLAAVSGSILTWEGPGAFSPLLLLWPPLGLGAAALAGAALQDRLAGLLDRFTRAKLRSVGGLAYGAVLLIVSLGLLSGSRDAARSGCSILRALQPAFLLLAGFGRGHLGTLLNAFALTSTSLLAGGAGAALSATMHGSLLAFFLAADHAARTLTEFPVEQLPPAGRTLLRGAVPALVIALVLGATFWQLPPAPYAPLYKAGAIATVPAEKLVGLLSNLVVVVIVSALGFYLLLRFGGGGRNVSSDEPAVDFVAAERGSAAKPAGPYREPAVSMKEWRARIVALYGKTAEQLAKWGLRRRPSQTPKEFARTLAPAGAAAELADLFARARYGPGEMTEAEFERASRASRELLDGQRQRP
ncbi:MAG: DUF4129 domain-containing protein [Planctomycetaceae bacterium]|nr:DUF4129 domain-containing protein [Planctomycetaceae bacterium]